MFGFFKKYNEVIYDEINKEVKNTLHLNLGFVAIASAIEKIFKGICEDYDLVQQKDYSLKDLSLGKIIHDKNIVSFFIKNLKITPAEIEKIDELNKINNIRKHSENSIKEEIRAYFRLLYDICVKAYILKFQKVPKTTWNEMTFNNLIKATTKDNSLRKLNEELKAEHEKLSTKNIELEKLNNDLQVELKKYSMPISRVNLTTFANSEFKAYDFLPKEKIKKISTKASSAKSTTIHNKVNLIKLGDDYKVNISVTQNLGMVFDFIDRGWFDEANKELSNFNDQIGDVKYAKFLLKYSINDISKLSPTKIVEELKVVETLINCTSKDIANKILNCLLAIFDKGSFAIKSKLFNVLSKYDFKERNYVVESFGKEIVEKIKRSEIEPRIVIQYISAIKDKFFDNLKNILELSIQCGNFNVANQLNSLILKENPKDIYALTKQLAIDCKCRIENNLDKYLHNLKNVNSLIILLDELSIHNPTVFLSYVDIISRYIIDNINDSANLLKNDNWQNIYKIFIAIYEYDIPKRDQLKEAIYNCLLTILPGCQSKDIYNYLESLLGWSKDGGEYLKKAKELAIASLDCTIKDDRFVKIMQKIAPNTFETAKLKFYLKNGLSFKKIVKLSYPEQVNKKELDNLIKLAPKQERNSILNELIEVLKFSITENSDVSSNLDLFNTLITYFNDKEIKELFTQMMAYAEVLIRNRHYEEAKIVLRQAISLDYKTYECCIMLLLCDYKVTSVNDLCNCKTPIIDNDFYNLAVKLAYTHDKDVYNSYLDMYSKQISNKKFAEKSRALKLEQEKKEKTRQALEKQRKSILLMYGITFSALAILILGIGIIFKATVGLLIMGIFIGVLLGALAIIFFSGVKDKNDFGGTPTNRKFIIALVIMLVAVIGSGTILSKVYSNSTKLRIDYEYNSCTVKMGINCKETFIKIKPEYNGYDITTVSISCTWNEHIETIVIPEGVCIIEKLSLSDCYNLTKLIIPKSVTKIPAMSLQPLAGFEIYYRGSKEEFKEIYYTFGYQGTSTIHYNYTGN